jgi:hypothetical protein
MQFTAQCTAVALTIVRSFLTSAWRECRMNMYGPLSQVNVNSLEILMARKPWMQAILRPEYNLLTTKDLRFPIPTSN